MRLTVAWSKTLSQNVALRFSILCLSTTIIGLLIIITKLAIREPIIIERACFSRPLEKAGTDRTESEISAFIKEALPQRFDSDAIPQDGYLSSEEIQFREQEQKVFKEKEMKERVLVNHVEKISGGDINVDADRILSVGPVRSVLPFPLRLSISSVSRSRGNPYGLRIVQVKPIDRSQETDKKK